MIGTAETINGKQMKQCQKCGKLMEVTKNFYKKKDGIYHDLCKKCLTMHIDNFDEKTYLWILKEIDVPYLPSEWNVIRNKEFAKNPNLNGMSVLGKYLSKMRIKQFSSYGWNDSERLQIEHQIKDAKNLEQQKEYDEEIKQQFENGEISEAQYKTLVSASTQNDEYQEQVIKRQEELAQIPQVMQNIFTAEEDDNEIELSEEEYSQLKLKWGKYYTKRELVELEKSYTDMCKSFDIQDADTINTLILVCKTNLKMNQSIDQADVEGYQKLSKVYNDLRKSAKFTAMQNKEEKDEFVDCVGNLVAYCEKEGGKIPKYKISTPNDIIDKVIKDLKTYTKDLIYEDKSLAKQIEDHLKKIEIANQKKEDEKLAQEQGKDAVEIKIQDYEDYFNEINRQREKDKELLEEGDYE